MNFRFDFLLLKFSLIEEYDLLETPNLNLTFNFEFQNVQDYLMDFNLLYFKLTGNHFHQNQY